MTRTDADRRTHGPSALARLLVCAAVGIVTGVAVLLLGEPLFAIAAGWSAASLVFLVWVWATVLRMDPAQTRAHARREDGTRRGAHWALLLAAVASLGAHLVILFGAASASSPVKELLAAAGLLTVVLAWADVHTLYTLRYAGLYHRGDDGHGGGIDFNQQAPPDYADFAYVAYTVGMTYAISDTNLARSDLRRTALGHALISFLFGTFILATTISLVAGIATPG